MLYLATISTLFKCYNLAYYNYVSMGTDLEGTGGRSPRNFRWGTAHALVPPIFGEVVLLDAWESTNWRKFWFWNISKRGSSSRKGSYMWYVRFETVETGKRLTKYGRWLKKSLEIFGVKMEIFSSKRSFENLVGEIFSVPPKLGAKSPPMYVSIYMENGDRPTCLDLHLRIQCT